MSQLKQYERNLPLSITENDGVVQIRCAATPEQNGGEQCVWSWRLIRDADAANGKTLAEAIQHAFDRHM